MQNVGIGHDNTEFRDKEIAAIFQGYFVKRLPREIQPLAKRKLMLIDAATAVGQLHIPPGNMLEKLSGNPGRAVEHSRQQAMANLLQIQ